MPRSLPPVTADCRCPCEASRRAWHRQLVGEGLGPLPGLSAGVGERAGGVYEAAVAQPVDDSGQLCLGQVADPLELFRPYSEGESEHDVGLGAADAVGEEGALWPPRGARAAASPRARAWPP